MSMENRYCKDAGLDSVEHLKNLTAADVKAWFDWIKTHFQGSIKSDGTLANYWRKLKRIYYMESGKVMDPDMLCDCINVCDSALPICAPLDLPGMIVQESSE